MDFDFELKSNTVDDSNLAQVVYANRHETYLHLVLRDKKGNLYPTRYTLWGVDDQFRQVELNKLQYLVDALRIPVLKNTTQLIHDDYIPFSTQRESDNVLWFINPCLPDSMKHTAVKPEQNKRPDFEVEVLTPSAPSAIVDDDMDLPPPPKAPVASPSPTESNGSENSRIASDKPDLASVNWDTTLDD